MEIHKSDTMTPDPDDVQPVEESDHEKSSEAFTMPEPDGIASGAPILEHMGRPRDNTTMGWLHGMTIRRRLYLSFLLLMAVIALMGGLNWRHQERVEEIALAAGGTSAILAQSAAAIHVMAVQSATMDPSSRDDGEGGALMAAIGRMESLLASLDYQETGTIRRQLDKLRKAVHARSEGMQNWRHAHQSGDSTMQAKALTGYGQRWQSLNEEISLLSRLVQDGYWQAVTAQDDSARFGPWFTEVEREYRESQREMGQALATRDPVGAESAMTHAERVHHLLENIPALPPTLDQTKVDSWRGQLSHHYAIIRDGVRLVTATRFGAMGEEQNRLASLMQERNQVVVDVADGLASERWDDLVMATRALSAASAAMRWQVALLALFGMIMGMVILLLVPMPIIRRIEGLIHDINQIAEGELRQVLPISSSDELGRLTHAVERMRLNLVVLVKRIQQASLRIAASVNEIQAASSQQSSTSREQAAAVNEFSTTLNQISQSAVQLASMVRETSRQAARAGELVREGDAKSSRTMQSMNAIGDTSRVTSDRIRLLTERMRAISETVNLITSLADQITLLALNAGIEANKAGDAGKGFLPVAVETRRLADRSSQSAVEIERVVGEMRRETESAVMAMEKTGEEIRVGVNIVREIIEAMTLIHQTMGDIARNHELALSGVESQAEASRQSRSTAQDLLTSATLTAQASRQTSAAAYDLNAMATQLTAATAVFKL